MLWLLLLLASLPSAMAQPIDETASRPGAALTVSLLTFGPGEEIWERFGHNAIEIRDDTTGAARLYNYGMFDFAQENFFVNFARGRMMYRMAVDDPAEAYPNYIDEGRWIVRQELNLSPEQRAKLADFLIDNARPENTQYRYDYFRANCSTRVRDAIDAVLGGQIQAQLLAASRGFTYRMDVDRLMRPELVAMLGIDAGLGPFADRRLSYWDESFLPTQFMRHAREITLRDADGKTFPLVANETVLNPGSLPEPQEFPPHWTWRALAAGILAALALLGLARARASLAARIAFAMTTGAIATICGIGGLILIGLWGFTEHVAAWRNENLLLFDPLCLLLVPAWLASLRARWRPSRLARRTTAAVALCAVLAGFAKFLPGFAQDNHFWIALLLPIHVALALAARILPRRSPRRF